MQIEMSCLKVVFDVGFSFFNIALTYRGLGGITSLLNLCPINVMTQLAQKTHFDLFCFSPAFLILLTSKPLIISKTSATHNSRALRIL